MWGFSEARACWHPLVFSAVVLVLLVLTNIMVGYIADGELTSLQEKGYTRNDLGWLPAFPHVLIASSSNFLFGYHIG